MRPILDVWFVDPIPRIVEGVRDTLRRLEAQGLSTNPRVFSSLDQAEGTMRRSASRFALVAPYNFSPDTPILHALRDREARPEARSFDLLEHLLGLARGANPGRVVPVLMPFLFLTSAEEMAEEIRRRPGITHCLYALTRDLTGLGRDLGHEQVAAALMAHLQDPRRDNLELRAHLRRLG